MKPKRYYYYPNNDTRNKPIYCKNLKEIKDAICCGVDAITVYHTLTLLVAGWWQYDSKKQKIYWIKNRR